MWATIGMYSMMGNGINVDEGVMNETPIEGNQGKMYGPDLSRPARVWTCKW
jgi:hypothetical protein